MLRSLIMSTARTLANDTDAVNPFHTDANLEAFIDDWQLELAAYLKYPRATQTFTFAIGDGPSAGNIVNAKTLNQDTMMILGVYFENTTTGLVSRLIPKFEHQIQQTNPQWRYPTNNTLPNYYVLLNGPAEGASNWPTTQITIDTPTNEARTMRIHYVQSPAASTTTTNSPIMPAQYHKSAVYYLAAQMLFPRNAQKADYFMQKYEKERSRQKSLSAEQIDDASEIWDHVQIWDRAVLPARA